MKDKTAIPYKIYLAEDEMPRSDTRYVRTHTSSMLSPR